MPQQSGQRRTRDEPRQWNVPAGDLQFRTQVISSIRQQIDSASLEARMEVYAAGRDPAGTPKKIVVPVKTEGPSGGKKVSSSSSTIMAAFPADSEQVRHLIDDRTIQILEKRPPTALHSKFQQLYMMWPLNAPEGFFPSSKRPCKSSTWFLADFNRLLARWQWDAVEFEKWVGPAFAKPDDGPAPPPPPRRSNSVMSVNDSHSSSNDGSEEGSYDGDGSECSYDDDEEEEGCCGDDDDCSCVEGDDEEDYDGSDCCDEEGYDDDEENYDDDEEDYDDDDSCYSYND